MTLVMKVVLLGDRAVGKTSLKNSLMGEKFSKEYLLTIGADFSSKEILCTGPDGPTRVVLQVWDLSGQRKFVSVRSIYYSGTMGALILVDITVPASYENAIEWFNELKKYNTSVDLIPVILIGNKSDLRQGKNAITYKEGQTLAKVLSNHYTKSKYEVPYYETSAKTGEFVDMVFQKIGEHIMKYAK